MLVLTKKDGSFVPGMGGDPMLFTQADAFNYVKERAISNPEWLRDVEITPYIPNPMHLDSIEYLTDKGFSISSNGEYLSVDCDTLWTAPMVDLLFDTIGGDHFVNRDFGVKFIFGKPIQVQQFQHHYFQFPIYIEHNGRTYSFPEWKEQVTQ